MTPFDELRVLEVSGSAAGAYAAKLFSDYGARVTKLEPPSGDPARKGEIGSPGVSPVFAYLNTGKRSLTLDLTTRAGRDALDERLERADVVIESSAPDPLRPASGACEASQLVKVYLSPFGSNGPYAGYRSNEFTDDAMGGHLYLNGEPDREPIARPGLHAHYQAGAHGFIGALAALRARDHTGRGQTVEVSHLEGLASVHQHTVTMWTHAGHVLKREGNRQPGIWHPAGIYECKDGHVQLTLAVGAMVEPFLAAAGLAELLLDPRFEDDLARGQHKDEFDCALRPWLLSHTAAEIVELGQGAGTPVGPVPPPLAVLRDPHLGARGFWRRVGREPVLSYPRGPFVLEGRESAIRPAPRLGASDDEVEELPPHPPRPASPARLEAGPLDGVRVLDLTRVWAGPIAGRMLGDLGADVILVEAPWARGAREVPPGAALITHLFPDNEVGERPWNRIGGFNKLNRNKRSVTLPLHRPEGKRLFEELVRHADVVLENYSPRVMPRLGLDFPRLRALNPHVLYVALSGYGASGPNRDRVALGPIIEAGTGLSHSMGYRDSGPYRSGVAWPDPVAGMHAVAATLLALRDREADPERRGRAVEVSMLEAMTAFVGEQLLETQLRGRNPPRLGSRHPGRAPQGCYPCAGADRWIAISVTSDAEWRALCSTMELDSDWTGLTFAERQSRHDEIDTQLASWTRLREPHAAMRELQASGVIACPTSDARALVEDPQLAARGFWADLTHPDAGRHLEPGLAIHFSDTPASYRRPAPCLGEHNAEVLRELLDLSPAELDALRESGTLVDAPAPR